MTNKTPTQQKNQIAYLIILLLMLILASYVAFYFITIYKNFTKSHGQYNTSLLALEQHAEVIENVAVDTLIISQTIIFEDDKDNLLEESEDNDKSNHEVDDLMYTDTSSQLVTPTPIMRSNGKMHIINHSLPKICIIVKDLGNTNDKLYTKFKSLDKNVVFAFVPNQKNTKSQIENAIFNDRDVIVQLFMDGNDQKDKKNPYFYFTTMSNEEISSKIAVLLKEFPQIKGISNVKDGNFLTNEKSIESLFSSLKENNLFYLDNHPETILVRKKQADNTKLKYLVPDLYLDKPDSTIKNAKTRIKYIQQLNKDIIIVITSGNNDLKYRQLNHFIEGLKDNHYQIVSLNEILK